MSLPGGCRRSNCLGRVQIVRILLASIIIIFEAYFIMRLYSRAIGRFAHHPEPSEPIESDPPLGNDVVPIGAYFDGRQLHSHRNATVILVEILDELIECIIGCEIDGVKQLIVLARPVSVTNWIKSTLNVTHTDLMLFCYDMEVYKDSSVSVLVNTTDGVIGVPVRREEVVMPGEGVEKDQVMLCATGFGSPEYLDQWLAYQQTIGINFIHLNVEASFIQNINKSATLQQLLASGYVEMLVWQQYLNESQVFYYSQPLKYLDCVFRYQNIYKYMMIDDFDEYFVPLEQINKDIHYYATRLLKGNIASVVLPVIHYNCKLKGYENMTIPKDGNVTKLYNTSFSVTNPLLGKSIHVVKYIEEVSVHLAFYLLPGYHILQYLSPHDSKSYIIHLTQSSLSNKECEPLKSMW